MLIHRNLIRPRKSMIRARPFALATRGRQKGPMDAQDKFAGLKPVDERHRFPPVLLEQWLAERIPSFRGPLEIRQFKGGQSNPTFQLVTPAGTYVLRRKPPGKLLPSAHAVDREFRVISALHASGFPVAGAIGLCQDDAIIGSWFYVMEMVEGRVFWNGALPQVDKRERALLYTSMIETLARLHALDPNAIGLGDYGKPGNYFGRQIERWSKQYRASAAQPADAMLRLMEWLPQRLPADGRVSIAHGDYRMDNLIFRAGEPRVAAVLDWELSTLGHPLADFTYLLLNWATPSDLAPSGLEGLDLAGLGIPDLPTAVRLYADAAGGIDMPDLDWCFAYNFFRLAAIFEGIAGRVREGTASSAEAAEMAARTPRYVALAETYARRAGMR
jgi:aminoglycoside phosphotransferase (APT) family kinase protein